MQPPLIPEGRFRLHSVITGKDLGSRTRSDWRRGLRITFPEVNPVEIIEMRSEHPSDAAGPGPTAPNSGNEPRYLESIVGPQAGLLARRSFFPLRWFSAIRAFTIFFNSAAGNGLSRGKCKVPFAVR